MEKQCTKCLKLLGLSVFYKDSMSKDGYSYWCNNCVKSNVRKHREDPEYRKKQMEWNNKWRFRPENREKVLQIRRKSQNKIHKILKIVGFVTPEMREFILKRDRYICLCCGTKNKLTIDHVIPISNNGKTSIDNLQTLCSSCNSKKQQTNISFIKPKPRMIKKGS